MVTFIKKIMLGQKKLNVAFFLMLVMLTIFEFVLLTMYTTSGFMDQDARMITNYITTMIIFVSFFLTLYMNTLYINNMTEELTIVLLSGRDIKQILQFIIIQFGTLFVIAGILGGILGILLLNGIQFVTRGSLYELFASVNVLQAIYMLIILIVVKILYVLLLNYGKMDIKSVKCPLVK